MENTMIRGKSPIQQFFWHIIVAFVFLGLVGMSKTGFGDVYNFYFGKKKEKKASIQVPAEEEETAEEESEGRQAPKVPEEKVSAPTPPQPTIIINNNNNNDNGNKNAITAPVAPVESQDQAETDDSEDERKAFLNRRTVIRADERLPLGMNPHSRKSLYMGVGGMVWNPQTYGSSITEVGAHATLGWCMSDNFELRGFLGKSMGYDDYYSGFEGEINLFRLAQKNTGQEDLTGLN